MVVSQYGKFISFLLSFWPLLVMSEEELVRIAIGNIFRGQDQTASYGIQIERDLKAIYSGAGLKAEFTYLPNERAIQSVINGEYDALDMRFDALDKEKGLMKVNVPLVTINLYLYSTDGSFYNSLDELKDKTVVSFHGNRFTDLLKSKKHLYLIHTPNQAALMLSKGRASVLFAPEISYLFLKEQFPQIKVASPIVAQGSLYHYIGASKRHLLERLEESSKNYVHSQKLQD
ncbi:transporter substrate-binding domain-containing protein [Vibrio hepatarius]|uniref:transporter substrate-binding domain-containing protein n=1 Tax=Vibrio hepatarius TaxID=171383 RepID=UPI001C09D485|nr:transporter substrate-binding domain-containing protein [Vibrio hepatarius]MBU2898062.1 transporter substrate-binding domain-containing protein [Vibrio hepatarius]